MRVRTHLLFLLIIAFAPFSVQGYPVSEQNPVHQHIAKEAMDIWELPLEIRSRGTMPIDTALGFPCGADFDPEHGDDIIVGSGEADNDKNPLCFSLEEPGRGFRERCASNQSRNGVFEHGWDPDHVQNGAGGFNCGAESETYNSGFVVDISFVTDPQNGNYDSAYRLAEDIWDESVTLWRQGKHDEAAYMLGWVVHLLSDMTVPSHAFAIAHNGMIEQRDFLSSFFTLPILNIPRDIYEDHTRVAFDRVSQIRGSDLSGSEYRINELPHFDPNFNWAEVYPDGEPSDLFKLFFYTAQRTQCMAVNNGGPSYQREPNDTYHRLDGSNVTFSPSICEGVPAELQRFETVNNNLDAAIDIFIPHAMRAVAGLYKIFWEEVQTTNIDGRHFLLPPGQQTVVEHFMEAHGLLSVAVVVLEDGTWLTVEEAVNRGILSRRVFVQNDAGEWVTSRADIEEWRIAPGRQYLFENMSFQPVELILVRTDFERTSPFFGDPLLTMDQ